MTEKKNTPASVPFRLLELAADIGAALTSERNLPQMLQSCADALVERLDASLARIWILDAERGELELCAVAGSCVPTDGMPKRISIGQGTIGEIALKKQTVFSSNLDELELVGVDHYCCDDINAFVGYPMQFKGRVVGVLSLYLAKPLEQDSMTALNTVADNIAIGIEHKRADKALTDVEYLFKQFAENMRDVFWVVAADFSKHYYMSPAFEGLWGRPRQELFENPYRFLEWIVPEDRERVIEGMARTLNDPGSTKEEEFWIERPDGERRCLWTRVFPIFERGKLVKLCGVAHDVTERKQADRRVSEFYSMVSHELRTPLTSIRAALGLIEGGITGPTTDETMDLIQIARLESDRLIRLINDILDIRKIEAGKFQLNLQALSPEDILTGTVAMMRTVARQANVQLITWIEDETAFVGDRDRVVQVLTNLISNALKFSPPGAEVNLRVYATEDGVRFEVADNGPGIAEEQFERLFQQFQQLDSSDARPAGGTGLGLAISKGIIEGLGGRIGVESKVGVGSTFWFSLPKADENSVPEHAAGLSGKCMSDFLNEYERAMPGWIAELSTWLERARTSKERSLVEFCLSRVRRLKSSSEPCGFPSIAERMSIIEGELHQILDRESQDHDAEWSRVVELMEQLVSQYVASGNNE